MPFKPPQIMKFHEAPCHKPPRSIVSMRLISVVMVFRELGLKTANKTRMTVTTPTPKPTHQLPERNTAMAATMAMMQNEPKVPFRLPPFCSISFPSRAKTWFA